MCPSTKNYWWKLINSRTNPSESLTIGRMTFGRMIICRMTFGRMAFGQSKLSANCDPDRSKKLRGRLFATFRFISAPFRLLASSREKFFVSIDFDNSERKKGDSVIVHLIELGSEITKKGQVLEGKATFNGILQLKWSIEKTSYLSYFNNFHYPKLQKLAKYFYGYA